MNRKYPVVAIVTVVVSLSLATRSWGQDQPAVFVHGIFAGSSSWQGAADRLQSRLAMMSNVASLHQHDRYEDEAVELNAEFGYLPGTTIAVGHSNGGVVSRQWSRIHSLGGITTIGTPHQGAPLISHLLDWAGFNYAVYNLIDDVFFAFSDPSSDWYYILLQVLGLLDDASAIVDVGLRGMLVTLGIDTVWPVMPEMVPGSAFLSDLNSPGNLAREASAIPNRVAIVNVARDFYRGGPLRFDTARADFWADLVDAVPVVLDFWATYIWLNAPPSEFYKGDALETVAGWFWAINEYWCRTVSDSNPIPYGACWQNDEAVPVWSQVHPGAPYIQRFNGPVHTQEKQESDDVLFVALTSYMHVSPRGQTRDVSFQVNNGQFITAEDGGGGDVNADRNGAGLWETFHAHDLDHTDLMSGDRVTFRTANGFNYLQADGGGGGRMLARGQYEGPWETFVIVRLAGPGPIQNGNAVALRTVDGPPWYATAEGGGGGTVNVNRTEVGVWETFNIILH